MSLLRSLFWLFVVVVFTPGLLAADPEYIYGMHDPGGESNMGSNKGWIVFTEEIGSNPNDLGSKDFSSWANQGYGIIVRLNNGYSPNGTLPYEASYQNFANRCANYIKNSQGCKYWIIGNETNLPREWPGNGDGAPTSGEPITAARYINCYNKVYAAVKAVAPTAQLIPTPAGTWSPPWAAQGIPGFVDYWISILNGIGASKIDGLALHAYTHGCNAADVFNDAKMGAPYENIYYHFRVYKNYMNALPAGFTTKPVFITECDQNVECADNQSPKRTWSNVNSGWVRNIYSEINSWNQNNAQKIRCVALFRWPMLPEGPYTFGIQAQGQVVADFQQACAFGYKWNSGSGGMLDAVPTGSNLSLNAAGTTTDSAYGGSWGGGNAVDGVLTPESKWTSAGTAPPHWLMVDLGSSKTVNGYIVKHAGAAGEPASYNTQDFSIQSSSSSGGPWVDETVVSNLSQAHVTNRTYVTPKSLRYIRLYILDPGIDNYARIPEFEIRGVGQPVLSRSPATLSTSVAKGNNALPLTFTVQNTGGGTANYTISSNRSWCSVSPSSGTSSGGTNTHTVNFVTNNLVSGVYTGTITISDPNSTGPVTIGVTVTVNPDPPSVSISSPSKLVTNTGPVTYDVSYYGATAVSLVAANVSLNKTGTANADIGVSGSGTSTRTVALSNVRGNGTLGISLAAGTASNTGGQAAAAGPSATFVVDNVAPVVTVSPSSGQTSPAHIQPVLFNIHFSESVVGFSASDAVPGGVGTGLTPQVTPNGADQTASISGMTANGILSLTVPAAAVTDAAGNPNIQASASVQFIKNPETTGAVKLKADGQAAYLSQIPVTAVFSDHLYVSNANRASGLRIDPSNIPPGTIPGKLLDIAGVTGTTGTGERRVIGEVSLQTGTQTINPLSMSNRQIGGEDFFYSSGTGAGQRGISGSTGLNMIGTLVRTWGIVVSTGSGNFSINDGGGPVKCILPPATTMPTIDSYIRVTGIFSCEPAGPLLTPVLKARSAADIAPL